MLERPELDEIAAKRPRPGNDRAGLAGLAQAALKAEAVTGDPAWDTFCSYLQQAINVAKARKQSFIARLSSPNMVNADQIAATRNQILLSDERITVLETVVNMPAEIKKVGSVAKTKLMALDIEEADAEVPNAA